MNEIERTDVNTRAMLDGFEKLLDEYQKENRRIHDDARKGQDKSDRKLDKMAEAIIQLTQSHIETRKDREYDNARMERIEQNQREQGKELALEANEIIRIKERQKSSSNTLERWTGIGNTLIVAGIVAYLGLK